MIENISTAIVFERIFIVLIITLIWVLIFYGALLLFTKYIPYGFIIIQFLFAVLVLVLIDLLVILPGAIAIEHLPYVWYTSSLIVLYQKYSSVRK
ncbi:hypothetical protein M3212_08680 [Alkalihalobacillus oceani]|uniref:hypothetical protein n=1 Tax=Halalkalibacter oceani TaxID=1653776 RepID=UPI00203A7A86|nr:hypothetical protein [Halalkalibacter oceani]MCM3760863.1 hypothetical protein [Halalkalibacter oceani]